MEIISKVGAIWGKGGLCMLSIVTDSGVCAGNWILYPHLGKFQPARKHIVSLFMLPG